MVDDIVQCRLNQFDVLRRVHLLPFSPPEIIDLNEEVEEDSTGHSNANVFRNLESSVSEFGENFSAGRVWYP